MTDSPQIALEHLQTLEGEIDSAMLAISNDSIEALEESLWNQQVLCVSLARVLESLRVHEVTSSALLQLKQTTSTLQQLNSTYAALVRQSQSSATLLSRLCGSYQEARCSDPTLDKGRLPSLKA